MALTTVRPEGLGFVNGKRNLIINGAMQVAQRGTVTGVTSGYGGPDRFVFSRSGAAVVDISQSTDVPSGFGFANSTKLDVATADNSLAAGDYALWAQRIEGQNLQSIKKGSSNAEKLTASFWIKSSTTGTYILEIFDSDNQSQVSASYSVSTADTWEHKVITFPADTTGLIDNDNATSLTLTFWLAAGSTFSVGTLNTSWAANNNANRAVGQVNAVDDAANNIYFTGVQLEIGEQATPFEHESYAETLQKCQRYCLVYGGTHAYERVGTGLSNTTVKTVALVTFPVEMRSAPSITFSSVSHWAVWNASTVIAATGIGGDSFSTKVSTLGVDVASGLTVGSATQLLANNSTSARLIWSAEL